MSWNMETWVTEDTVTVAPITYPGATQYQDARSAAFYAMGIAIKKRCSVTLVVPGQYLTSTYTAITEAWFQKANVIVIALFDKASDVKTVWMDRCVVQTGTYGADEEPAFLQALEQARCAQGPVLLNRIGFCCEEQSVDYSHILNALKSVAPDQKVMAYFP